MPDYFAFQFDDKTLALLKGQNVQLLLLTDDLSKQAYIGDGTVADAEGDKNAKLAYGVAGFDLAGDLGTKYPTTDGWSVLRFRALRSGNWWSRDLPRADYATSGVTVADKDGDGNWEIQGAGTISILKLAKGDAWNDDARRAFYFAQLERSYPHLKGLLDSTEPASALRAEAATMLAMLELSEEMKDAFPKETRTARAKTIMALVPKLAGATSSPTESRQVTVANPLRVGRRHADDFTISKNDSNQTKNDGLYEKFFADLWAKLEEYAGANYLKIQGQGQKPRVRVIAVGDGGGTNGLLNKPNECIGFTPYSKPSLLWKDSVKGWQSTTAELPPVDGGKRTVLHMFVTGLNQANPPRAPVINVRAGDRSYKFNCVKQSVAAAQLTPIEKDGFPKKMKAPVGGVEKEIWRWEDGTTFDPSVNDLAFALSTFLTGATSKLQATVVAGTMSDGSLDEMIAGFFVIESYQPVALLGLFGVDKHVPLKPASAVGTAAKERLARAYEQIDEIVAICLAMDTFEVKLVAGGPGKKVAGGKIESATQTEHQTLHGGKNLDGTKLTDEQKQDLRASFLDIEAKSKHVKLTIPSFTDPDYSGTVATPWDYNYGLSARRSWGLLGLIAKRVGKTDKKKASALWASATMTSNLASGVTAKDTSGKDLVASAKDDYLATTPDLTTTDGPLKDSDIH